MQRQENDKWAELELFNNVKIVAIEDWLLINMQFTLQKHGNSSSALYQNHKGGNVDSFKMNLWL